MNNNDRIQGLWWLSDKPDNTVSGDLLISDRKLELNGSFEGIKSGSFGGVSKIISIQQNKTILGIAKKGGKRYTLEFYDEPSFSMSFPGYKADTYFLGTIFEGDHFTQTATLSFQKYYVEFPYLFEWVGDSVIASQIMPSRKGKPTVKDITIRIGKQKTINVFKNNQFKLSFVINAGKVSLGSPQNINVSQQCLVKIETVKTGLSLVDLYPIIFHLERFLVIAVGKSLRSIQFQAVLGKGAKTTIINIFPRFLIQKERSKIHPSDMNFTFSDIKNDSQVILKKWFSDRNKHSDTFNLFSFISSDSTKNLNNQFKDIVSAIEGYVRIEKANLGISLDKAIKILNEEVPQNDRPIPKSDYKKIRITRNKLSHVAIKIGDEKFVLDDEEKWTNFNKLLFIFEYSLLKNLGMSSDLLDKFYKKKKIWS